MAFKYNVFTSNFDIVNTNTDSNTIQQVGATYPAPTSLQLLGSVTYIGNEFPIAKRPQDTWIEKPTPVVQTAITDITSTEFRVNWNVPVYANATSATVFEGYQVEISTDNFVTTTTVFTTLLTHLFTGLSAGVYKTRVKHVQRFDATRNVEESVPSNEQTITLAVIANLYNNMIALNPLFAFNLRTSLVADTTVPNLGSLGGTFDKSGTFTKNVGLVAGLSGLVRRDVTALVLGNSAIANSRDWALLVKFKAPNLGTNKHLYSIHTAGNDRFRLRSGAVADDGLLRLNRQDVPSALNSNFDVGLVKSPNIPRVVLFLKRNNEIEMYENGSIVATRSNIIIGATTEFNFDKLELFGGMAFGAGASAPEDTEIEYGAFHHTAAGAFTNANDYINLMPLTI